jgi:type II secretory pathway pseudopilin PulG
VTSPLAGEKGVSLVEQLVALALIGVLLVTLLYALSGGTLAVGMVDDQVLAGNLATSALEAVKDSRFVTVTMLVSPAYTPTLAMPAGYTVTVAASPVVTGLQWVTATVAHNGRLVLQLADFKANR